MKIKFQKKSTIHPRFVSDAVSAVRSVIGESCNNEECTYSSGKHKAVIKDGIILLSPSDNPGLTDAHVAQSNQEKNTSAGGNAFSVDKAKTLDESFDVNKVSNSSFYKPTKTATSKDVKDEDNGFENIADLSADVKRTFDAKLKVVDIEYTIVDKTDKLTTASDENHETIDKEKKDSHDSKQNTDKKEPDISDELKDQFLDAGNTGFSV